MDADSGDYKRLPDSVDAGFSYVSDIYSGESIRRRRLADEGPGALQDSNDSGADFEVVDQPQPGG